jgi:hypothetical protein
MKSLRQPKRSLRILFFSLGALLIIAGGYVIFRYSSIAPRLFHEDKGIAANTTLGNLQSDVTDPRVPQTLENPSDTSNTTESTPAIPKTPGQSAAQPGHGVAWPSTVNLTPPVQAQHKRPLNDTLQQVTQLTQNTVKDLLHE